jgi:3-isopropylmalate/(R)-2-methylmalate dehydratase small subunit
LLPILVSPEFLNEITTIIQDNPSANLGVNLEDQTIAIENSDLIANFEIDAYKKICMINGFDDIDFLINNKDKIEAFEKGKITEVQV